MAANAGRKGIIDKAGVPIAGARTTGMTVNGSPIDITDQNDNGFLTVLDGILTDRSIVLTIDGIEDGNVLRDLSLGADTDVFLDDITYTFSDGDTLTADFVMSGYNEGNPYKEATTFSATFTTTGTWTHTKAV